MSASPGTPLAVGLPAEIAVTRVENFCASGTKFPWRGHAVASARGRHRAGARRREAEGHMAACRQRGRGVLNSRRWANASAPEISRRSRPHRAKHGVIERISARHGACVGQEPRQRLAFQGASAAGKVTMEQAINAPMAAQPLGLFDCGVSDGSAPSSRPEIARSLGKTDINTVKALQFRCRTVASRLAQFMDGSYFATARVASKRPTRRPASPTARRDRPDRGARLFSVTELVTMEDLSSRRGSRHLRRDGRFHDHDASFPARSTAA